MTINTAVEAEATKSPKVSRALLGTVVSSKMDKTIVVRVERLVKHALYGKYMRDYSKMVAHDAENQCREGDVVRIKQTRPLSKTKRWVLVELVRRPNQGLDNVAADASNSEESAV